jgi:hypothetical protein
MSPTKTYDAQAADLVTRTLAAVAGGTDVADEERESGGDRATRLDTLPLPPGNGRHRRLLQAAIALGAAAAVAVGVVVSRDESSDVTTGAADQVGSVPQPAWLPPGVDDDGELLPTTGDTGLDVEAAVLQAPGGGDVLAAAVSHDDGTAVEPHEADWVVDRLAGVFGASDDEAVVQTSADDPRAFIVVPRGGVDPEEVDLAVAHLAAGTLFDEGGGPRSDWSFQRVPVDWVPGLAPTVGQGFVSDDGASSVDVFLVAGELPGGFQLGVVLGSVEPRPIGDAAGWRWRPADSEQEMLLWQEAPGTIGVVVAGEVSPDDLVRVAESVEPEGGPPSGDGGRAGVRIVAESNDGSAVDYWVEWADRLSEVEGRCVTLVVEDEPVGPTCEFDRPDAIFTTFGPVALRDALDVYWGIVGPSVLTVEIDQSGGRPPVSAEALPLDQGDPDSMRYVVITAPHADVGTTTVRFLDGDGGVLDTETIDFVGELPEG